jgi:hypothetical protein
MSISLVGERDTDAMLLINIRKLGEKSKLIIAWPKYGFKELPSP